MRLEVSGFQGSSMNASDNLSADSASSSPKAAAGPDNPCNYLGNRFVYLAMCPRARGLSVGINMNPDKQCNYDCVYCEVDRQDADSPATGRGKDLDVAVMVSELEQTLDLIESGKLREFEGYQQLPVELLTLRHVALSGDGEPTISREFNQAIEAVIHLRALGRFPYFKLALITNGSGLNRPEVLDGLRLFTPRDEVWVKLDAGTQDRMERVNQSKDLLDGVLAQILRLARQRPVIIQGLFPALGGQGPSPGEIDAYARRLKALKEAGAQIPLVQIYSATRAASRGDCGHLPLRTLSGIARQVREISGLPVEVF